MAEAKTALHFPESPRHQDDNKQQQQQPPNNQLIDKHDFRIGKVNCNVDSYESSCFCCSKPAPPLEEPVFLMNQPYQKVELKNIIVILNPFGGNGRGKRAWQVCEPIFAQHNIQTTLFETKFAKHATQIAREAPLDAYQAIVIIGGDGTIHEAITGLLSRPDRKIIPVGFIPGGTGNSIMVSMESEDPKKAAMNIAKGFIRKMDLMKVDTEENQFISLNIVTWGLGADVNVTAESCRCFGQMRYDCAAIWQICKHPKHEAQVDIDGKIIDGDYSFIIIQNNQHSGVKLRFTPFAKVDDGCLDALLLNRQGRGVTLDLFGALKDNAKHIYNPNVSYYRTHKMKITTPEKELVNIDGENCAYTPITVTCMSRVLPVFFDAARYNVQ